MAAGTSPWVAGAMSWRPPRARPCAGRWRSTAGRPGSQGRLRPLDHSALPHLRNVDPRFLDRPHDPGNRHTTPYFWGVTGIAYDRTRVGPAL